MIFICVCVWYTHTHICILHICVYEPFPHPTKLTQQRRWKHLRHPPSPPQPLPPNQWPTWNPLTLVVNIQKFKYNKKGRAKQTLLWGRHTMATRNMRKSSAPPSSHNQREEQDRLLSKTKKDNKIQIRRRQRNPCTVLIKMEISTTMCKTVCRFLKKLKTERP